MADISEAKNTKGASASPRQGWWRTVSSAELRASPTVVSRYLEGGGAVQHDDFESFARALALQQLFDDTEAIAKAAHRALDLMPEPPSPGAAGTLMAAAGGWLIRGRAIEMGLIRCLELLKPREEPQWDAAVECFQLALHILDHSYIRSSVHGGTTSSFEVRRPLLLRPRKV